MLFLIHSSEWTRVPNYMAGGYVAIPLEVLDKYVTTSLDFWRLRPRKFLSQAKEEPSRYLSPAQFAGVSSGIIIALAAVTLSVAHLDIEKINGSSMPSPEAFAVRTLVFLLSVLFANSLFYRVVSRFWPIRGKVTLVSVFEFQCYLSTVLVLASAVDVLIDPITISLVAHGAPSWVLFIPAAIGGVAGFVFFFLYQNPGVAQLNDVSSLRMFLGTLFWVVVPTSVVGFLLGILIGFLSVRR